MLPRESAGDKVISHYKALSQYLLQQIDLERYLKQEYIKCVFIKRVGYTMFHMK